MRSANRTSASTRYRVAIWLALCVFALKALVPQGFMLGADPGTTLIQLCSANGPVWIKAPSATDHDHHDPSQQDAQHAEQSAVCPAGAAVAAAPLVPSPWTVVPIGALTLQVAARAPPSFLDTTPLSAPLGARAPPALLG